MLHIPYASLQFSERLAEAALVDLVWRIEQQQELREQDQTHH